MPESNINFSALVTAYTTQRRRDVHCIYSNTNLVRVGIIYIKECRIAHRVVLTALLATGQSNALVPIPTQPLTGIKL
jgi:hypothetical protein